MWSNRFIQLSKYAVVSTMAIGVGYRIGQSNGHESADPWSVLKDLKAKPGLPIFGSVSAATAISRDLAPVQTPAEVAIPQKDVGIPSEPLPGQSRIMEIMRFGFPGLDNIRSHRDYVVSYDRRSRLAHWVFEHLTRESVKRNDQVDRQKSEFKEDLSIHPFFRSSNQDYKYSGFDRGHLAAAGNHRQNQDVCNETFLLSNMAPQVGVGFNRDKWEHLERYVRNLTKLYRNVYVCTGPLYLPKPGPDGKNYVRYQVIGANNVAVPTHFFKVIVGEMENRDLEMEAYVLPNEAIPDDVPPDSVERAAGLLFFDRIARNQLKKINGKKIGWL
ncbi:hypothetical protein TCAL_03740 [Tigriopus californicus]|uniref:Endonuclease n=1 Tax=Tigriopus californicus TaxID=6832 RepID=A0A553NNF7_TIGCA|nr:hypothetical protein TCAL_03740 [Tigriopus californicus]|eukprot:TCALIF_03740-PA protein Name:"Similar to cps-6 Endonuclease G, mitochondrial (Caenorhabditis elegans)" AED:0.12 eAED:0.12 QI:61/0.8/0.83/1/0.8/0.83/6/32/328